MMEVQGALEEVKVFNALLILILCCYGYHSIFWSDLSFTNFFHHHHKQGQDDAAVKQEHETPEPGLVLAQEPPKTEPSDVDASMTLVEVGEREYSLIASKLLIGSWVSHLCSWLHAPREWCIVISLLIYFLQQLLKGANPHATSEAEKSLFNIEVSTNGAQRIKYEITQPGASLMIDYEISSIS